LVHLTKTYGDFDRGSSDIDFLIVLHSALSERQREQVKNMHAWIAKQYPIWAKRIEASYITKDMLQSTSPPKIPRPYVNGGQMWNSNPPYGNDNVASKKVASAWVKKTYGKPWSDLIEKAESWQHGQEMDEVDGLLKFIRMYDSCYLEKLYLMEDLDAVVVFEVKEKTLKLYDVLAVELPTIEDICTRVPSSIEKVEIHFCPDRFTTLQFKPVLLESQYVLMVRGPFSIEGEYFRFPITANF
jgi:hypothetical protein